MGKSRFARREESGKLFNLYAANTSMGWRVIRQISGAYAAIKVASGEWRPVSYEQSGDLAGYQEVPARFSPPVFSGPGVKIPGMRSVAATITLKEMQMNAGLFGRSRTLGRAEWKRKARHAKYDKDKVLAPEDAIERAVEKVRLWPYPASVIGVDERGAPVFGDKAVRVYPHAPHTRGNSARRKA